MHSWGDVPLHVPEHLVGVTIARDVADVIVPRGHRLAGRTRVSPRDLVDEPWVATPDGTICRQWLMRMYDGTGRAPRIAHVAMEFDSHLALVGAGLGIALIPRLGRNRWPPTSWSLAAHKPVPTREITVLHRASMVDSPAVRAVVAALSSGRDRARLQSMTRMGQQFGPDFTFLGVPMCDLDDPSSYDDAAVVILGAPFDGGTSHRPGARFGPMAIRMQDYLPHDGSRPSLAHAHRRAGRAQRQGRRRRRDVLR